MMKEKVKKLFTWAYYKPIKPNLFFPSLAVALFLWMLLTDVQQKMCCMMVALTFGWVEICFTGMTHQIFRNTMDPRYIIKMGKTTWEQFVFSVFWSPIGSLFYKWLFSAFHFRFIFFPINIFVAEIVGGYYLTYVWGRRAWNYTTYNLNFFDGNITLLYIPCWWFLCIIDEIWFSNVLHPLSYFIASLQPLLLLR